MRDKRRVEIEIGDTVAFMVKNNYDHSMRDGKVTGFSKNGEKVKVKSGDTEGFRAPHTLLVLAEKFDATAPREVERREDMGAGSLLLFRQDDGDWILRMVGESLADHMVTCSIEFCTPMTGGGASPKTWEALFALAKAMQKDCDNPQKFGGRAEHLQKP